MMTCILSTFMAFMPTLIHFATMVLTILSTWDYREMMQLRPSVMLEATELSKKKQKNHFLMAVKMSQSTWCYSSSLVFTTALTSLRILGAILLQVPHCDCWHQ